MNKKPSISIVLPVHNVEQYIKKCFESIAKQTLNDIEIIFVNDGSTDDSGKLCDDFALNDKRVKVYHKENEGALIARKIGIEKANGKYIYFVDPDDYLTSDASLEKMYQEIERRNVDILNFDIEIDGSDKEEVQDKKKYFCIEEVYIKDSYNIILNVIYRKYTWHLWNKIFKSDVCKKAVQNIKNVKMYTATDAYMYLMIAYYSRTYQSINTSPLYTYRLGSGITTHKNISLEDFKKYVNENKIVSYFSEFLLKEDKLSTYKKLLDDLSERFLNHCCLRMVQLDKIFRVPAYHLMEVEFGVRARERYYLPDRLTILRYRILSKILFGKKRLHYKNKVQHVSAIKNIFS